MPKGSASVLLSASSIINKLTLDKKLNGPDHTSSLNPKEFKLFMKIASSLKSLKKRDLNSKLVRRRGRVYIINKKNPKFKARQK